MNKNIIKSHTEDKLFISIVKCDEDCECDFCTAFNKIICGCDEEDDDYGYEDDEECENEEEIVYGYYYNEEDDDDGNEVMFDKNVSNKVVEKPCKVCKTNLFDYEEICWKCGALNPTD